MPDDCKICGIQKVNIQEHVFSNGHIAQVKALLENGESADTHSIESSEPSINKSPAYHHDGQSQNNHSNPSSVSPAISQVPDPIGLYNQFLLQNHMFGQLSGQSQQQVSPSGSDHPQSQQQQQLHHHDLLGLQHHLAAQQSLNNSNSTNVSATAAVDSQSSSAQQHLLMENNLLLQINADNTPPTNSEILQQLYNYSQMSGELIK